MVRQILALALLAMPLPAMAQFVPVRLEWIGNDAVGGLLVTELRRQIRESANKRETSASAAGIGVIVQTMDPAVEWQDAAAAKRPMTVYSVTLNRRASAGAEDTFGSVALGWCMRADLVGCAREIVAEIDQEIARRGMR